MPSPRRRSPRRSIRRLRVAEGSAAAIVMPEAQPTRKWYDKNPLFSGFAEIRGRLRRVHENPLRIGKGNKKIFA